MNAFQSRAFIFGLIFATTVSCSAVHAESGPTIIRKSAYRLPDRSLISETYLDLDKLQFETASPSAPNPNRSVSAFRVRGVEEVTGSIGDEPVIVENFCDYFANRRGDTLRRWFRQNTTSALPVARQLNLNGSTAGQCGELTGFLNQILLCDAQSKVSRIDLRALHAVSRIERSGNSTIIDASTGLTMPGLARIEDLDESVLRKNAPTFFTPDGYNLPSGISIDYFLMALGKFDDVRDKQKTCRPARGQSDAVTEQRLNWVSGQRLVEYNAAPTREGGNAKLLPGQELIVAANPMMHEGLLALQRDQTYYFREITGGYDKETFRVLPQKFSSGVVRQTLANDALHLLVSVDFYAIEIIGNCKDVSVRIDDDAMVPETRGERIVVPIIPARPVKSVAIEGCSGPFETESFFLVPDRIARSMKTGRLTSEDISSWGGALEVAYGQPVNLDDEKSALRGYTESTISVFDKFGGLRVVRTDGWAYTEPFQSSLAARTPDYLDYPIQKWVVNKDDMTAALEVSITLPDFAHEVTVATLGMLSSQENHLSVSVSRDGINFHLLYEHQASSLASYKEGDFQIEGREFYLRIEGLRRSRLVLDDANFVSLSHLLVTPH